MTGFSKKILLANMLGNITTEIFDLQFLSDIPISSSSAWLGSICYSLQLFYDFAGYSDMAIGISNMFDIDCPENFNYPYTASSISDFWRRWHISLGSWFRDYVYIPMGGSQNGYIRMIFSLFVVWLLTGLWHGVSSNFVFWGLAYFILITFEKIAGLTKKTKPKIIQAIYHVFILFAINLLWIIFRIPDLNTGFEFIKIMFVSDRNASTAKRAIFLLNDYKIFIVSAILFAMPIAPQIHRICQKNSLTKAAYQALSVIVVFFLFLLSVSFIVSGNNNPFIYADF